MLSRVFRSRLPKTVQIRRFCQPNNAKIEKIYKKIQSDPDLKDFFKDMFKNEPLLLDNKSIELSKVFNMLENESVIIEKNQTQISLEQKNTKTKTGFVEDAIINCVVFYGIGFGIMFVLVSIAYVFICAKQLLTDKNTTILSVPFMIVGCGLISWCYAIAWPISILHIMKYGLPC